ncbi:hypothetical protein [Syntrophomonas zehnderi]|nr:hypothetical protein [Syntrophomonas zehnderi]
MRKGASCKGFIVVQPFMPDLCTQGLAFYFQYFAVKATLADDVG